MWPSPDLINTPLQRGVPGGGGLWNRFNGFPQGVKTVETVFPPKPSTITPLKRGVNEKSHRASSASREISRFSGLLTARETAKAPFFVPQREVWTVPSGDIGPLCLAIKRHPVDAAALFVNLWDAMPATKIKFMLFVLAFASIAALLCFLAICPPPAGQPVRCLTRMAMTIS
jgi:hypothetical protein